MQRGKITFWFFVSAVILVGIYFFKMIQPFVLPLLLAGTMAVLVQPIYQWVVEKVRGQRRIAACIVSLGVVFAIVLPTVVVFGFAAQELVEYGEDVVRDVKETNGNRVTSLLADLQARLGAEKYDRLRSRLENGTFDLREFSNLDSETYGLVTEINGLPQEAVAEGISRQLGEDSDAELAIELSAIPFVTQVKGWFAPYLDQQDLNDLRSTAMSMMRSALIEVYGKTANLIADFVSFVIGFAVMMLAFYYFLAEGPSIAEELEHILPFETKDEVAVAKQFETLCRGVVLGTLVAAIAQATLLGIALTFLGVPATWLLTCLTVVCAMIPFVGSGGVYVPVTLYLLWNERYAAGIFLLIYGIVIVSTVDNLIRAYMIHGTSRLHPLVALVSALGALQVVGLWGIFVGPVVAGIFYALLKILQEKLKRMDRPRQDRLQPQTANVA